MSFLNGIARRAPSFSKIFGRFPLPVLASLIAAVVANLDTAEVYSLAAYDNEKPGYRQFSATQVYAALTAAFFASGAAHLFAESAGWKTSANYALAGLVALVAAAPFWIVSGLGMNVLLTFWLPAILLLLMISGFMRGQNDDLALWGFNYRLGLAVILAGLAALAFVLGAYAVLSSIDYLFELNFKHDVYEHIYMTGLLLVAPLFGLEMVPENLHDKNEIEKQGLAYRVPHLLLNYLLLPLLLIYTVILYAYAAKIAFAWELPRGQIGVMVLSFAAGCVSIWLLAIPYRENSSLLLRLFQRSWYWLLIVPLVLFSIGTYRRLVEYGITPERYGLVLVGIWIVGMICLFAIRGRNVQPRVVIATLAIMLMLASYGPWGAADVSVRDQFGRLVALLDENQILVDGKLTRSNTTDYTARQEIRSIVEFLSRAGRLDELVSLYDLPLKYRLANNGDWQSIANMLTGNKEKPRKSQTVIFRASEAANLEVRGQGIVSGPYFLSDSDRRYSSTDPNKLTVELHPDKVSVDYEDMHWEIASQVLLDEVQNRHPTIMDEAMPFALDGSQGQAWLIVQRLTGDLDVVLDDETDASEIDRLTAMLIILYD